MIPIPLLIITILVSRCQIRQSPPCVRLQWCCRCGRLSPVICDSGIDSVTCCMSIRLTICLRPLGRSRRQPRTSSKQGGLLCHSNGLASARPSCTFRDLSGHLLFLLVFLLSRISLSMFSSHPFGFSFPYYLFLPNGIPSPCPLLAL